MPMAKSSEQTKTSKRKMHPNSLKNLQNGVTWKPGESGNPQGQSLVVRFREQLKEVCPFDSKGRRWFETLSEAAMRQALIQPVAMRELLDRLEGKVTQPISGDKDNSVLVGLLAKLRGHKSAVQE